MIRFKNIFFMSKTPIGIVNGLYLINQYPLLQLQLVPAAISHNDNRLAISALVLVKLWRFVICTYCCKSSASYIYILHMCGATIACYFLTKKKLLLCRTNTNWGMGRWNDTYEWWNILTIKRHYRMCSDKYFTWR